MKKATKIVAILLAAAIILSMLSGCATSDVKSTIKRFETACQNLDVRGMLECYNPTVSDPILTLMTVFGVSETDELLDKVTSLLSNFGSLDISAREFFSSIKIDVKKTRFENGGKTCLADAELSYGTDNRINATITCILKNETWYISAIDF